ncbi:hypothetical protein BB560_004758 [Smittium megazygosporum]|uniref:Uncharacterized protein n=1 Tax=Smittium megazygosporum TaxID=133381 RepID=A0A2T9Z8H6_9FUNG|nr:hypothetical protein BB560_004758 [Smittium megazygosporum]
MLFTIFESCLPILELNKVIRNVNKRKGRCCCTWHWTDRGPGFKVLSKYLSKANQKVFQLSSRHNYGDESATFSLEEFLNELIDNPLEYSNVKIEVPKHISHNGSSMVKEKIPLTPSNSGPSVGDQTKAEHSNEAREKYQKIIPYLFISSNTNDQESSSAEEKLISQEVYAQLNDLLSQSRKYYLESRPIIMLSRGPLINLLASSGMGQFMEFKGILKNCIVLDGLVSKVPDSKQSIFSDNLLDFHARFKLGKFVKFVETYSSLSETQHKELSEECSSFVDLLEKKFHLDAKLVFSILYSICGSLYKTQFSVSEGIQRFSLYASSLGRFGDMAYLYPLYGGGSELSQVFCRSSAVNGSIFMMDAKINEIQKNVDGENFCLKIEGLGDLITKNIVSSGLYDDLIPELHVDRKLEMARAVFILKGEGFGTSAISLSVAPKVNCSENIRSDLNTKNMELPVYILQLPSSAKCCPQGKIALLYFWTKHTDDAHIRIQLAYDELSKSKFLTSDKDDSSSSGSDSSSDFISSLSKQSDTDGKTGHKYNSTIQENENSNVALIKIFYSACSKYPNLKNCTENGAPGVTSGLFGTNPLGVDSGADEIVESAKSIAKLLGVDESELD